MGAGKPTIVSRDTAYLKAAMEQLWKHGIEVRDEDVILGRHRNVEAMDRLFLLGFGLGAVAGL